MFQYEPLPLQVRKATFKTWSTWRTLRSSGWLWDWFKLWVLPGQVSAPNSTCCPGLMFVMCLFPLLIEEGGPFNVWCVPFGSLTFYFIKVTLLIYRVGYSATLLVKLLPLNSKSSLDKHIGVLIFFCYCRSHSCWSDTLLVSWDFLTSFSSPVELLFLSLIGGINVCGELHNPGSDTLLKRYLGSRSWRFLSWLNAWRTCWTLFRVVELMLRGPCFYDRWLGL